jgi:hypothetical protein
MVTNSLKFFHPENFANYRRGNVDGLGSIVAVQQFAHERLLCCLISIFGPSPIGIRYLLPRWAPLVAE